jgi:hypothetical protein
MNWSQGYVADIAYTANFYRETAPSHVAFAALSVGRSPGRAFRLNGMLEFGFGQAFGLSLLAAANLQFERISTRSTWPCPPADRKRETGKYHSQRIKLNPPLAPPGRRSRLDYLSEARR